MQLSTSKRSGKTYGRANKNLLVHDLFECRATHHESSSAPSPEPSPVTSSDVNPAPILLPIVQSRKHHPPKTVNPSATSSIQASQDNTNAVESTKENPGLFDLQSSDDGDSTDTSGSRASKRRRITKPSVKAGSRVQQRLSSPLAESNKPSVKENKALKRRVSPVQKQRATSPQAILPEHNSAQPSSIIPETVPQITLAKGRSAKQPPLPRVKRQKSPKALVNQVEDVSKAKSPTPDASEYLSDRSHHSALSTSATPGVKGLSIVGTDSELSSPSQFGSSSLKPDIRDANLERLTPDVSSDADSIRRSNRRRLIDRLDVPSRKSDVNPEDLTSDTSVKAASAGTKVPKLSKNRIKLTKNKGVNDATERMDSRAGDAEDEQNKVNRSTKPRTTYATQRSHLSDMVEDVDMLSAPSSQKSVDERILRIPTQDAGLQLELEDEDNDDQSGPGKLKSIHELRQAGANNRFDLEIDALLDDMSSGDNVSKAVRLQALLKLAKTLRDESLVRHLAQNGRVERLTSLANQRPDLLTSILLLSIFSSIVTSQDISLKILDRICRAAMDAATVLLVDDRSLSKIAKDRKQNLSRAMVKDIVDFEKSIQEETETPRTPTALHSDMAALMCLNRILHRIIELGDTSARVSTSVYSEILRIVQSQAQYLQTGISDSIDFDKLETTLSLLEICSVVVDDGDLHIGDSQYETLGNSLAEVIHQTGSARQSLQGSALRVVVSLSNNKPRMCRLLGHTGISRAAFRIITDNFMNLAKQAENEAGLDQSKLDCVVLATGCLLNFAECDDSLRSQLAQRGSSEDNYIEQLVAIFNNQVSKVDEAMTKDQSQVSVAFGYLSMLLCALSLHPSIKSQVTQLLKHRSFEELCTAAEKFFSHLRTLEHISEDDSSMSTFTARFSAILDTIRAPAL